MNFNKTVFWITGASSGIGKATALELSKTESKIILSSRNKKQLLKVKNECQHPENVRILPLDLADYLSMPLKVEEALKLFGTIDVLFNNGGVSQRSLAIDTAIEVDKQLMDVNYIGTVALTKALLPFFIKNKKGHFVVTTSVVGKIGSPLRSSYAASKHALHGFFDSLRAEIYKYNISVTIVCPGFVQTNVSINALTGDGSAQNKMDVATKNGLIPSQFAKRLLKAVSTNRQEVYIGKKEIYGIYLKRFFPRLLAKLIQKVDVV